MKQLRPRIGKPLQSISLARVTPKFGNVASSVARLSYG